MVEIRLVRGVGGYAIYVNDFRVCGPKPYGGGKNVESWDVSLADIRSAFRGTLVLRKAKVARPKKTERKKAPATKKRKRSAGLTYCVHCGLDMRATDFRMCPERDGDFCQGKSADSVRVFTMPTDNGEREASRRIVESRRHR